MPTPRRTEDRPELHEVLPRGSVELHASTIALHRNGSGDATAPEWVHVVPVGDDEHGEKVVRGRDGRRFVIDDPQAVLDGTELPMQFDWEHLSMYPPAWGGTTRAAGWIDRLEYLEEADDDRPAPGVWGRVERWTDDGRRDVEGVYYRGLSPVVRYQPREPEREGDDPPPPLLRGLLNVALTNRPNLRMTLLHSQQLHTSPPTKAAGGRMNERMKALRARLGLPEDATHEAIMDAAIAELTSRPARTDYDALHTRATAAEAELAQLRSEHHAAAAETALENARKAGKIAPASVPHYQRMCATPEGLAGFNELAETLPVLVGPAASHATDVPEDGAGGGKVLTAQQRELAENLGLTEEEFAASL